MLQNIFTRYPTRVSCSNMLFKVDANSTLCNILLHHATLAAIHAIIYFELVMQHCCATRWRETLQLIEDYDWINRDIHFNSYQHIREHLDTQHGNKRAKIDHLFKVLKKCRSKFDCLIYEMLFVKDIKPSLNTQSDSIRAKLFTWHFRFFCSFCLILGIIPIGHTNIFIVSRCYIFSFQLLSSWLNNGVE